VKLGLGSPSGWRAALDALTFLRDRRFDPGTARRAFILAALDRAITRLLDDLPERDARRGGARITCDTNLAELLPAPDEHAALAIDARRFPPEGPQAASRAIVAAHARGWRRFLVYRTQGDRFLGCGLGPDTSGVRIDVYGSSGDYLGSGLDGAHLYVHGDAQDQAGQILKAGRIVVFGNVGQTFLYGAKGGEAFVMGSAAGRPLINAVGQIRALINGTCLDYCAESFMAGERLGGGFVIINGLGYDARGEVIGLELKYPGNNLFSLASGGACYLNDPYHTVTLAQLNGASFVPFKQADWNVILPYLRLNEDLFGISIRHDLLVVDGVLKWPKEVFRKIVASTETEALDWSSLPD
jgi:glutamate synthase domain-containing protein 3